jgi:hypothetical protein
MKAQNPSTSLGEGRDVAPSLAHPSQKQNLGVYTEELTHLFKMTIRTIVEVVIVVIVVYFAVRFFMKRG